ncbi:alpha-2-macroglobulin family protein [Paenirhodobacter sp. CAU 1674]|uniref:alpha-2-macroglobulin family protein n=1 Tax=Paenirhodobacter sp. CAU 1674 TaxID=3032596 RepID=UPI0023DA3A80|nr:alpha-2-macroglobulin family protein [Paenirhodobacter sp. CAU 1674]MDF2141151.1 alpha-2-macroglobulin family protein [Paenirhodobacter sp. CAU 1674]
MRVSFKALSLAAAIFCTAVPLMAQDGPLVPARRMVFTEGMDLAGRDLAQIFDTTLESCEAACLANPACEAVTFNARNNSCFPKAEITATSPYQGAFSGFVRAAAPGAETLAQQRAAELGFLNAEDFDAALRLAQGLGRRHLSGDWSEADLAKALAAARGRGNLDQIWRLQGALLTLTDAPDQWVEYARTVLTKDGRKGVALAIPAALNGYLRAPGKATRAEALSVLAQAFELAGRGRDMIPALTLAQALSSRTDIAAALDDATAKYGFRVSGHEVEADSASPRICAQFNADLVRAGTDYASFVQLPKPGLSVEATGDRICVEGFSHGERQSLTFRKGLPAASGEVLARDVTITAYIRDRSPAVRFPGRAYVLPRAVDAGLPVETVNTEHLDLRLLRVSDRNLVAAMREDYFARSLDYWQADYFTDTMAEEVWTGTADVAMQVNRDMTTRLPVQEVTGPLGPGVYALQASVPGKDEMDNPAATQWFVISDLGLSTYSGTDGLTVAVRGLSDAAPRADVAVELISKANAVLGQTRTDAAGVAHFDAGIAAGRGAAAPALVTVASGDDMAFLSLTDAEFDLSDRGVEGLPPAPPIDVFLATDRGAYRVGETIHATMLARDAATRALPGLPLTAVLMRPDGVEYSRMIATDAGAGGHVASFALGGQAPRGTWRLDVFADLKAAPLASSKLLVEDFLPERIDFDLSLPDGLLAGGDIPEIGVDARYLFGAPGADLEMEGDLRLSAATDVPGFEGYRFARHDAPFSPWSASLGDGTTDAAGHGRLYAELPDMGDDGKRPLDATFTVRVKEGSGRPVERSISRIILPADPVIGIRPMFDDTVAEGAEARFRILALGQQAAPVPMQVHWVLNRVETRYQWYSLYGSWNWEAVTHRKAVAQGDLSLGAEGPAEIGVPVDWGQYELVVERVGGAYTASSVGFDAGWYAPADVLASPDRLELSLDKPGYRSGDVARLRVVPATDGVALVSVLSNRLISLKSVPVTAGENVIELPVTDDWGAGAYVTASVIRPLEADAPERAPVRAMGLAHAAVDPGARQLQAAFEAPTASDPRAALPVAIKVDGVAPGETAHVSIAAVDLGILNLTGFKSPDPSAHYFGQRRLGVGLRDIYGRLIDGQAGEDGIIRSGGDAGREMTTQAPPPTEELVAYFSGPLEVGADGYARTEFQMPAFNGTVRLMAVVWSETGVGQAQADVLVRDPVVVTASVPRFLAPGDQSRMLLEIVHASGPSGRMGLDLTSAGLALGAAPSGVDLADLGKTELSVPITAPQTAGLHQIRIALTTPDGKLLEKMLTLPVQQNDPAVAHQSRFDLAAGNSFTFDANALSGFVPGTARAMLAVGPLAQFDTAALLDALDTYPYGCTEQVTSKALPLLYLSSVAETMGLASPADLRDRVEVAIRKVLTNQDASGAFGLWSASSGDLWLDAYVSDFLSRARHEGYAVPDAAFRNAMDNLRNQVNYAPDFDGGSNGGGRDLAYALMVLAREGAASVSDLRYYADVKGGDFATPLAAAQLGAALASYGDQTRADAMFARAAALLAQPEDAALWRADYGTALRDRAGVLALAAGAGSQAVPLADLGQGLASRIAGQRLSTQEAAWTLLATHAMIDRPGLDGFTVNGAPVDGPLLRMIGADTAGQSLDIRNGTARPAVLTLTTIGVPEVPEPAGGKGYSITRQLYAFDGSPVDPGAVKQGDRLVEVLEITPHGPVEARLMVADPLPAGFEIDNPNLLRAGDLAALDWLQVEENTEMTEFRQDRFLAALNWRSDRSFRLAYILRAVSPGSFHRPAASVEDMYRPDQRAQTGAERVVIQ